MVLTFLGLVFAAPPGIGTNIPVRVQLGDQISNTVYISYFGMPKGGEKSIDKINKNMKLQKKKKKRKKESKRKINNKTCSSHPFPSSSFSTAPVLNSVSSAIATSGEVITFQGQNFSPPGFGGTGFLFFFSFIFIHYERLL